MIASNPIASDQCPTAKVTKSSPSSSRPPSPSLNRPPRLLIFGNIRSYVSLETGVPPVNCGISSYISPATSIAGTNLLFSSRLFPKLCHCRSFILGVRHHEPPLWQVCIYADLLPLGSPRVCKAAEGGHAGTRTSSSTSGGSIDASHRRLIYREPRASHRWPSLVRTDSCLHRTNEEELRVRQRLSPPDHLLR